MKESDLMKRIQVEASKICARLWRNNSGALKNDRGQWVTYGLGVGTSDLIGLKIETITQEMVGKRNARFVAIEVKSEKGRATPEQENFVNFIRECGGIATICKSTEEALTVLSNTTT